MKGKMIIFIILLMFLFGTAYAGNNTTEIKHDSHTIEYSDNISYALESGDSNISFSNGYHGYCVEYRENLHYRDKEINILSLLFFIKNNLN